MAYHHPSGGDFPDANPEEKLTDGISSTNCLRNVSLCEVSKANKFLIRCKKANVNSSARGDTSANVLLIKRVLIP